MGFAPLPVPDTAQGRPRRTGVEIEFGGLDEARVADICAEVLGGEVCANGDHSRSVTGSSIGEIEVILDTALRKEAKSELRDFALKLGREVIPVEIVTEPLDADALDRLLPLEAALREAGALGSGAGYVFGFGIHFNPEIVSEAPGDVTGPLMAYALIEDWLRWAAPIDPSRRVLPFTAPYPTQFVRALIDLGPDPEIDAVRTCYLEHSPTRNRGLDMLPVFAHLAPDAIAAHMGGTVSARPTFHFRLPDCLIDNPDWSITQEWDRWIVVEKVAGQLELMQALRDGWGREHGAITLVREGWARWCDGILRDAGIDRPLIAS